MLNESYLNEVREYVTKKVRDEVSGGLLSYVGWGSQINTYEDAKARLASDNNLMVKIMDSINLEAHDTEFLRALQHFEINGELPMRELFRNNSSDIKRIGKLVESGLYITDLNNIGKKCVRNGRLREHLEFHMEDVNVDSLFSCLEDEDMLIWFSGKSDLSNFDMMKFKIVKEKSERVVTWIPENNHIYADQENKLYMPITVEEQSGYWSNSWKIDTSLLLPLNKTSNTNSLLVSLASKNFCTDGTLLLKLHRAISRYYDALYEDSNKGNLSQALTVIKRELPIATLHQSNRDALGSAFEIVKSEANSANVDQNKLSTALALIKRETSTIAPNIKMKKLSGEVDKMLKDVSVGHIDRHRLKSGLARMVEDVPSLSLTQPGRTLLGEALDQIKKSTNSNVESNPSRVADALAVIHEKLPAMSLPKDTYMKLRNAIARIEREPALVTLSSNISPQVRTSKLAHTFPGGEPSYDTNVFQQARSGHKIRANHADEDSILFKVSLPSAKAFARRSRISKISDAGKYQVTYLVEGLARYVWKITSAVAKKRKHVRLDENDINDVLTNAQKRFAQMHVEGRCSSTLKKKCLIIAPTTFNRLIKTMKGEYKCHKDDIETIQKVVEGLTVKVLMAAKKIMEKDQRKICTDVDIKSALSKFEKSKK